jgi:hypothetical protein
MQVPRCWTALSGEIIRSDKGNPSHPFGGRAPSHLIPTPGGIACRTMCEIDWFMLGLHHAKRGQLINRLNLKRNYEWTQ